MPPSSLADHLATWPTPPASCVVLNADGELGRVDTGRRYPWASVTKVVTALVVLDAVGQGLLDLDEPAGPPGASVRHLLAHASGLSDGGIGARVGARRIYCNTAYELLADLVAARTGSPFAQTVRDNLAGPLGMSATLDGSPAHGMSGTIGDLATLAGELLHPRLLDPRAVAWLSTPAFAGLTGVLPGYGRQRDNLWGLGAEIRDHKDPHWTGRGNSPATFGHFGQSGSFLWVDPAAGLACVALTGEPFGPWALAAWTPFNDWILGHYRGRPGQ